MKLVKKADLTPGMKKAVGLGLVFGFLLITGFVTNKMYNDHLDKRIYDLDAVYAAKLEELNAWQEWEYEGKDSKRIEADMSKLNHMFGEIFSFENGDEFLTAKQEALTTYNWNKNFVEEYFDETELYDADGNMSSTVNMKYSSSSSKISLVSVTDDDRYYHYICDVVVYVGNYVLSNSAQTHIIADVMMNEDSDVSSIYCYNTK